MCKLTSLTMEQNSIHLTVTHQFMIWLNVANQIDFSAFPIIIFCDSSWQDCVDTGRSRGAYHIYVDGSLVKSTTFVSQLHTLVLKLNTIHVHLN